MHQGQAQSQSVSWVSSGSLVVSKNDGIKGANFAQKA